MPQASLSITVPDHKSAVNFLIDWLEQRKSFATVRAVGHRVVHGMQYISPELVTQELLDELHRIRPYDPEHLPREIELIEAFQQRHPQLPQLACFDTAFHSDMPRVAKLLPIPRRYDAKGVQRYGFHGLSYAYLMEELARLGDPAALKGRVILAHLGNGASLAAMHDGKSVDIARVSGLPSVGFEELVKFPGGAFGIAFNVDEDEIGVVLLGEYSHLHAGDEVERTGRVMDVGVGDGLLGRVIDPLGRPLDDNGPVASSERLPIERPAAAIMDRAPVTVPLQTGLKVIDALIPIGHGQRELILGDRRTGKTAIALDTTHHARAYRELSLLLRRPPGREAFPGDIFYIHSRLLERATHLCKERGGGSVTALPIIETEAQNISAYIPTNLISIRDGQIYLSPSLFELGVLPAVDVAKSVSRVGGKVQRAAYRAVAGDLKLAYAQFEELETFSRFGARLDDDTRKIIEHGRRIRACLKQPEFSPVAVPAQIAILLALTANLFDPVPLDQMKDAGHAAQEAAAKIPAEVSARFETADKLSDEDRKTIIEIARQALVAFLPKPEAKADVPDQKSDKKPEPDAKDGGAITAGVTSAATAFESLSAASLNGGYEGGGSLIGSLSEMQGNNHRRTQPASRGFPPDDPTGDKTVAQMIRKTRNPYSSES